MEYTGNELYHLLERLCFVRYGGTPEETRAANLLQDEIQSLGGSSDLMPFEIPAYQIEKCQMTVNGEKIACTAMGHSGQLPEGGVDLPLKYVESNCEQAFLSQGSLKGCAVLINTFDIDIYRELAKRQAAAIIEIDGGKWYENQELISWEMRPPFLEIAQIPTFTIRASDALKLLKTGADTVHLQLRQHSFVRTSHNVTASVKGTHFEDESIVLTAHYDSASVSPGAYDNGSGAAALMYIYNHYLHNPPKRTMRFIWCGSEEQGLLGSKAYVDSHKELLPTIKLCYNLDSCGTVLGENLIDITGSEALLKFTEQACSDCGFAARVFCYADSSDSAVFADCGIPAICPSRGHWTSCECHTRKDQIDTISPEKLLEMGEFSVFLLDRLVNAEIFPVDREIPQDMAQQLNTLFYRDSE